MANSCILWFRWALFAEFIVSKLKLYEHHPDNPKRKTIETVAPNRAAAKTPTTAVAAKPNVKEDPLMKLVPLPRFLHHLVVQTWKYLSRGTPEHHHILLALIVCHAVQHGMLDEEVNTGPTGVPEDDHTIFDALFPVSKIEFQNLVACFGLRSAVERIQATADALENRIFRASAKMQHVPDAHIHALASAGPFLIGNRATPLNLQEAVRAATQDPLQSGVPVDAIELHPWITLHAWRALSTLSRDITSFQGVENYLLEKRSVPVLGELVAAENAHVLVILFLSDHMWFHILSTQYE